MLPDFFKQACFHETIKLRKSNGVGVRWERSLNVLSLPQLAEHLLPQPVPKVAEAKMS